ncbi:glutamate-aspartate carrier protein [Basidiobolus meristosporus CBS 931.73]|uniref:Amino acid transporter n=1 Tax=Basidiobolus meristosporus CBS 931.73 TaxID=1314790 RepID=A0A1Y1X890_9FUNG|nr:glutamate-aspartate carrier protein [Basidiobolus meristosporus CBS 931.73]|eukprot:ORX81564.1 glutamate-aspartate carrier protein [Basidiobolus meristosporus CBS 931.73]
MTIIGEQLPQSESQLRRFSRKVWRILCWPSLTHWIITSMILGIIVGWLAPSFAVQLQPLSNIFVYMIKAMITPLLFATLAVGIAGHGDDLKKIGSLAIKSLIYFEVITTIALVLGVLTANLFKPGHGVHLEGYDNKTGQDLASTQITWEHELYSIIPQSFFKAAADNAVLQIVFCAIMFAVALVKTPAQHKQPMITFLDSLANVMFKVTGLVMNYAPIGIFAALSYTVGKNGISVLSSLGKLVGSVYLALVVFIVVIFIPIMLIAKIPILKFVKCISQPLLIAFTTYFGVPKKIVAFVLPTGYSFNLDGGSIYFSIATLFAAQAGGVELSVSRQAFLVLTLMLTSKGVAGVPRAGLVVVASAVQSFDLPYEAVAVLLGVEPILEMGKTAVNVAGNCIATVVMAKLEGEFPASKLEDSRFTSLESGEDKPITSI